MPDAPRTTVLFTGYAPVHFVCFRPLFERLAADPDTTVLVSGGLRTKRDDGGYDHDLGGLFDPFGVPASSRVPVDALGDLDVDCLFAANTKMIAPRSVGRRVQIFHGISFRNKAVREDNAHADDYFVVGPYMRRAFAATGILPEDDPRAHEIGFLKTDALLDGSLDRDATLAAHGLTGARPVLVYAPTGQKHNSLETMGEEALAQLAATGAFDVIVKPHDHPKRPIDWAQRLAPLADEHLVVSREPDVVRLMHAADLLITDASSVSSEFSLLDRPMVFLDVPRLIEKARAAEGAQVDLETWGRRGGEIVPGPDDVVPAVERALADPDRHADVRRAMAADLFFNPGHATDAAMQWLRDRALLPAACAG